MTRMMGENGGHQTEREREESQSLRFEGRGPRPASVPGRILHGGGRTRDEFGAGNNCPGASNVVEAPFKGRSFEPAGRGIGLTHEKRRTDYLAAMFLDCSI